MMRICSRIIPPPWANGTLGVKNKKRVEKSTTTLANSHPTKVELVPVGPRFEGASWYALLLQSALLALRREKYRSQLSTSPGTLALRFIMLMAALWLKKAP